MQGVCETLTIKKKRKAASLRQENILDGNFEMFVESKDKK